MTTPRLEPLCSEYEYDFRPDLLRGKVAFITGGGSGICFTIAEILMRHQCDVVISSRKLEKLEKAAGLLERATQRQCFAVQADVRKPQEVEAAVDKALEKFGKIDILVNGAAGNFLCLASDMSYNAFRTIMDIDTVGTFNVSKVIYKKYMQSYGGVIVNITATMHFRGVPMQCHVGAAKSAIEALTKHLAVEWGPNGVRVLCVAPGPIADTEGYRRLAPPHLTEAALNEHIPLGRIGTRCDIANIILFLVSNAGSLITGTTIVADGGQWLGSMASMKNMLRPSKL